MGETVSDLEIVRRRLRTQRLLGEPFATPAAVVAGLLAVQSQEYAMAKWALGMRSVRCTDTSVEAAFAAGEILRTHILRPTWHFVSPADIRWLLQLTAPRIRRLIAGHARELELEGLAYGLLRQTADFREGVEAIVEKRRPEFTGE